MIRYAERNPLRVGLVERAEDWLWSSLHPAAKVPALDPGPIPRGTDWVGHVNAPMTEAELTVVRLSLRWDRPYGRGAWTMQTASLLGLEYSTRPPRADGSDP